MVSPLSVGALRSFGECQQPSLEESRGEGPVSHRAEQPIMSNHNPPELFLWSRPLWGPLVPPYVVKVELVNESCLQAKES